MIMKKLTKQFTHHASRITSLAFAMLITVSLFLAVPVRSQVTGTYVNPRTYTLWSGTITNGMTNTVVQFTNLMNYSGWHNIDIWESSQQPIASSNTLIVAVRPGIGPINGYTNAVTGTNQQFTTAPPVLWAQAPVYTGTALVTESNITQTVGDGVYIFQVAIFSSGATTNGGYPAQIDATLTP
jgi:hypothetical protein